MNASSDKIRAFTGRVLQPALEIYGLMPKFLLSLPFFKAVTPIPGAISWNTRFQLFGWTSPKIGPIAVLHYGLGALGVPIGLSVAAGVFLSMPNALGNSVLGVAVQMLVALLCLAVAAVTAGAAVLPALVVPVAGVVGVANFLGAAKGAFATSVGLGGLIAALLISLLSVASLWVYAWPIVAKRVGAKAALPTTDSLSPAQGVRVRSYGSLLFKGAVCATVALISTSFLPGWVTAVALMCLAFFGVSAIRRLFGIRREFKAEGLPARHANWLALNYGVFGAFCAGGATLLLITLVAGVVLIVAMLVANLFAKKGEQHMRSESFNAEGLFEAQGKSA